jgi:Spy/CpxP family protein refolding chaperone
MGHGMRGCGMALIHAHPDVLKAKFGLTDGQVSQLAPLRTGFLTKRIQLHSQVQQLGLQMKGLFEADLPDQNKVLDVSRKIRNLQGQIAEERIKTMLKIMQVLTKDQRTQLRAHCPMPGMGMGMGMGKGKGEGWGEGGGPGGGWGGGQ